MKYIQCKFLKAECSMAKHKVLEIAPVNEYELIKAMEKYFYGIKLKQLKNGKFKAYGEITEEPNKNLIGNYFIGHITFIVPSCTVPFTRDNKGYILNHNQFN